MLGRVIDGRFKIIKLLGEGGMGQVYLAEQTSMGRPVALKVLNPTYGSEERIKDRFRNEAALASRLNHPSTVIIYDFGVTGDGLMFIAMELIEGMSLHDTLEECGTMAWQRAARIVQQICGSLQDAHEKAIIHRDLKPENIMLMRRKSDQDLVKVLDFGVAKILADNDWKAKRGLTAPNEIFGTPEYMSPEQARGDETNPSTDIYSLGIILFRMLTGQLPFDGHTPIAILAKHLADEPPRINPTAVVPVIPDEICRLVDQCLSKKPAQRPPSMADVNKVLDRILNENEPRSESSTLSGEVAPVSAVRETESIQKGRLAAASARDDMGEPPPQVGTSRLIDAHGSPSESRDTPCNDDKPADINAVESPLSDLPEKSAGEDSRSPREITLDKLMARIQKQRDFPAVSQHISELNTKVALETTSAPQLSNVILKDTSLTTRLIKLANSAYYGNARGGTTTVSRAVVLMGFNAVREAALGLLLFDNLRSADPSRASELRDSAIGALMGAIIAKEQAAQMDGVNKEEAFICAMFHTLGKHAAVFYFSEEMEEIRKRVDAGMDEDKAVLAVLGISLDDLGQALATFWDFPEEIRSTMAKLPDGQLGKPRSKEERLRHLAGFSTALVKIAAITDPAKRQYAFEALSQRFNGSFTSNAKELDEMVTSSLDKLEVYARNMNLNPGESAFLRNVLSAAGRAPSIPPDEVSAASKYRKTRSGKLIRDENMSDDDYRAIVEEIAAEELVEKERLFQEGVAEVAASIKGHFDLNGVMLMVLETMYRGLGLNRVIFSLHDVRTKTLRGRFGFGDNVDELIPDFHFPAKGRFDVFSNAVSSGEDAMVVNLPGKPLPLKVPLWYRNLINAPLFLLYPIRVRQFPAALFYGDFRDADRDVNPALMSQMQALRDQATRAMEMANRPKGRGRRQ